MLFDAIFCLLFANRMLLKKGEYHFDIRIKFFLWFPWMDFCVWMYFPLNHKSLDEGLSLSQRVHPPKLSPTPLLSRSFFCSPLTAQMFLLRQLQLPGTLQSSSCTFEVQCAKYVEIIWGGIRWCQQGERISTNTSVAVNSKLSVPPFYNIAVYQPQKSGFYLTITAPR